MAVRHDIVAFNRGILDKFGLARIDIERLQLAAEVQTNWVSRVLGSMSIRAGWQYTLPSPSNNTARGIPFVYAEDDLGIIEFSDSLMRVIVNDALVTRPAVTAAITNGDMSAAGSWTDNDESGAASTFAGGILSLLGDGTNAAIREQVVTVNEASVEHALRIDVERGPVLLRVGSTSGGDQYIAERELGTGEHSIAFTPTGNFYVQLLSRLSYTVQVDSCEIESSGAMTLISPYAAADLRKIRFDQSGGLVWITCDGYQQYKIERLANTRSWSLVKYEPETGPFRIINTSNITLTPSGINGNVTLTASKALFKEGHVGALFRQASKGQTVTADISAEDSFTDPIRVTGVGEGRRFSIIITGTFSATVTVQYSVNEPGSWVDLTTTYTGAVNTSYLDNQDNQVIYYRIGVKSGDYTSGTVEATLTYSAGSIQGVARITAYTSATLVNAVVLQDFGSISASTDWWEGAWSTLRGFPTAVQLHEGRLWMAGRDSIYGSISDAYEDFDDEFEGDAAPISRSIGEGPIDSIHWMMALGRLLLGTALTSANVQPGKIDGNSILGARSSSFGEPMTPTNFNMRRDDVRGVYVDRSKQRVYELGYGEGRNSGIDDYVSDELTLLVPTLNESGLVHLAVQMKPDIRIHCVRNDGTVGLMTYDRVENVLCWQEIETTGDVEDVVILPGDDEDDVYYLVERTINAATVRYWEKWAKESNCKGDPVAHLADAHYLYAGAETTTITGLDHLEGESVVVWGWNTSTPFEDDDGNAIGRDLGSYTVASGQITVSTAVTNACVGLTYTAQYKMIKLSQMNQQKKIMAIALSLLNTHADGIQYGQDFVTMYDLPQKELGRTNGEHHIYKDRDTRIASFGGQWETDPRLCLQAVAPRPATVRSAMIEHER